ncbi:periplasmic heavy metal sensor [Methylopila musalis]|uniref:Periplasmic heavy metal sensor n=1 Tax=Methylopila musalis TaxID=1134781 RepID=A0ABW3ZC95_9HYPH
MAARSRWLYAALAVSVTINLVGAGFLMGHERPPKPGRTVDGAIAFVAGRYPEAVGAAIRDRLENRRTELGAALAEMQGARQASRAAMAAEPVNAADVAEAFRAARAKADAFQSVIHGAIAEAMPGVPAEERAKVLKSGRD